MKRNLMTLLAGLVLAALPALAAAGVTQLRADIPFSFEANGKVMPAGPYRLEVEHFWRRVMVLPMNGGHGIYVLPFATSMSQSWDSKSRLEFRRYYDRYFLSLVATGPGGSSFFIPPSRAEKAIMKAGKPEVEVLAVKVQ